MAKTQFKKPSAFSQYKALLTKDIFRELHTKEMVSSMGIYAFLVLIVYGAALSQAGDKLDILQMSGGLIWVLVVFTSLLGLNRSFSFEKENGALDGLLLVPMDRSLIFLAKATSNFLFMALVEVIAIPLFCFFFLGGTGVTASAFGVVLPLLLGTIGLAGVGTLLSTITINTRGKDVMLATLMIPLAFPLLYSCVSATTAILVGGPDIMDILIPSITLATAYDVIMCAICWLLCDYVVSS